jgi:hypothetical protein
MKYDIYITKQTNDEQDTGLFRSVLIAVYTDGASAMANGDKQWLSDSSMCNMMNVIAIWNTIWSCALDVTDKNQLAVLCLVFTITE